MKWLGLPRGAGKTERLLQWAAGTSLTSEPHVIVVHSAHIQGVLRRQIRDRGLLLEGWQIQTWHDLQDGRAHGIQGRGRPVLAVDNADLILQQLLGGGGYPIEVATATVE